MYRQVTVTAVRLTFLNVHELLKHASELCSTAPRNHLSPSPRRNHGNEPHFSPGSILSDKDSSLQKHGVCLPGYIVLRGNFLF